MAEGDRSQLPLPSPGSRAEERKQGKSTSELREISEETYELRKTADGEYEKKTTKSERHERKTSDEETFVAAGLPSPTVSPSRWHEQVPERVKVEVSGVTAEGCPDASSLDADYILDLLDRRPERCRWEYTFRAKCQLFRCCLEAFPDADGKLTLRAFFEGSAAGPVWTQTGLRDLSGEVRLSFHHQSAENPSAGCRWPETLALTPLATSAGPKPFYISPEPTVREMAEMASASAESSSSGSCAESQEKKFYAGAPKYVTDCIGSFATITTNNVVLDCESKNATFEDGSWVFTGVTRFVENPTIANTLWAQTGYRRTRNEGGSRVFWDRFCEVKHGPNIPGDIHVAVQAFPTPGTHTYESRLNTDNGLWTFKYDGTDWYHYAGDPAGWTGKTGNRIEYNGEISHKLTQMAGKPPEAQKCKFTVCRYHTTAQLFINPNLNGNDLWNYDAAEWGEEVVAVDAVNIWDKKPPFSTS